MNDINKEINFLNYVHVYTSMGFPKGTPERKGSKILEVGLLNELKSFQFNNVSSDMTEIAAEDVKAFNKAMHNSTIYITVHYTARPIRNVGNLQRKYVIKPSLNITETLDQGRPVKHHIQIIGGPNTGKTSLANMYCKVINQFNPTIKVIIVDIDPYTQNFYYLNDAGRELFLKNVRGQKINIGQPMHPGI